MVIHMLKTGKLLMITCFLIFLSCKQRAHSSNSIEEASTSYSLVDAVKRLNSEGFLSASGRGLSDGLTGYAFNKNGQTYRSYIKDFSTPKQGKLVDAYNLSFVQVPFIKRDNNLCKFQPIRIKLNFSQQTVEDTTGVLPPHYNFKEPNTQDFKLPKVCAGSYSQSLTYDLRQAQIKDPAVVRHFLTMMLIGYFDANPVEAAFVLEKQSLRSLYKIPSDISLKRDRLMSVGMAQKNETFVLGLANNLLGDASRPKSANTPTSIPNKKSSDYFPPTTSQVTIFNKNADSSFAVGDLVVPFIKQKFGDVDIINGFRLGIWGFRNPSEEFEAGFSYTKDLPFYLGSSREADDASEAIENFIQQSKSQNPSQRWVLSCVDIAESSLENLPQLPGVVMSSNEPITADQCGLNP